MVKVNLKDVKGFENVPDGEYAVNFTEFKVKDSKNTAGTQVIMFTYTIADGEHNGRKLFKTFSLQPQALWSLKATLVNLGIDPTDLEDEEAELEDLVGSLIGNEATVVVKSKTMPNNKVLQDVEVQATTNGW